jgi:hypothetical protein
LKLGRSYWEIPLRRCSVILAAGADSLRVPMGGDAEISISSSPVEFVSPLKLEFDGEASEIEGPIDDELLDGDEYSEDDVLETEEDRD